MLGLSNGPKSYPFVSVTVYPLGFVCLRPSKKSLMLWAWANVAKNGPLHLFSLSSLIVFLFVYHNIFVPDTLHSNDGSVSWSGQYFLHCSSLF
jgi:hypothetical protein